MDAARTAIPDWGWRFWQFPPEILAAWDMAAVLVGRFNRRRSPGTRRGKSQRTGRARRRSQRMNIEEEDTNGSFADPRHRAYRDHRARHRGGDELFRQCARRRTYLRYVLSQPLS